MEMEERDVLVGIYSILSLIESNGDGIPNGHAYVALMSFDSEKYTLANYTRIKLFLVSSGFATLQHDVLKITSSGKVFVSEAEKIIGEAGKEKQ